MENAWWYADDQARHGPVSAEVLSKLLLDGKISASTLVWHEGQPSWTALSDTPELQSITRAVPPELPKHASVQAWAQLPRAGHWRRGVARLIDLWIIGMPLGAAMGYAFSSMSLDFALWIQQPGTEYLFGWLNMPLVMVVETGIFALAGTTPGKALLGIKVMSPDGGRLTGAQYLRRQWGVYWYGAWTFFPLLSLVGIAIQQRRLIAGRETRYDEGHYEVRAAKLGFFRSAAVLSALALLFAVNAVLQGMSRDDAMGLRKESMWTNPVTGLSVSVPRGWKQSTELTADKQPAYVFIAPESGFVVVLAKEDFTAALPLDDYQSIWAEAVKDEMVLMPTGHAFANSAHESAILLGHRAADRSTKVRATLLKKGGQFWRMIVLAPNNKDPSSGDPSRLQDALVRSIG